MSLNGIEPMSVAIASLETGSGGLPVETAFPALLAAQTATGDLSQLIDGFLSEIRQASGTLTFNNGTLVSDVTYPSGNLTGTYNLVDEIAELSAAFQELDGTLNVANGTLTGDLSTGDELLSGSIPFTQTVDDFLTGFLGSLSGDVPFQNGQLTLDVPTPLGPVTGTLDFGNGALESNLMTPFGDFDFNLAFGEDLDIPFSFSSGSNTVNAVIDLSEGVVGVDLIPAVQGNELSIPLSSISGNVTFENGVAAIAIPTALGDIATSIDLGQLVDDYVVPTLNQTTGTLSVSEGILTSNLTTPLGDLVGSIDGAALLTQLSDFAAGTTGTITLSNGLIVSDLTTPSGDVDVTIDLREPATTPV